jgi:hypothetical protein
MIHVVTVHWNSDRWITPQLDYLERNVRAEYRVWASLTNIDRRWHDRFHTAVELEGTHAEKLNTLASMVAAAASPDDLLVFLDGDAFPVSALGDWLGQRVAEHRLIAVRRDENAGDVQPHPCFCATTVGFWQEIDGDWSAGGTWRNARGEVVTDVGGTLLHRLADLGIDWLPLRRSNTVDLHPLWFGVYASRICHHGAGFRPMISRVDQVRRRKGSETDVPSATDAAVPWSQRATDVVAMAWHRLTGRLPPSARAMQVVSDRLYEKLRHDPGFAHRFDPAVPHH